MPSPKNPQTKPSQTAQILSKKKKKKKSTSKSLRNVLLRKISPHRALLQHTSLSKAHTQILHWFEDIKHWIKHWKLVRISTTHEHANIVPGSKSASSFRVLQFYFPLVFIDRWHFRNNRCFEFCVTKQSWNRVGVWHRTTVSQLVSWDYTYGRRVQSSRDSLNLFWPRARISYIM